MITRREAISNKVYDLLGEISTANGNSIDFDGKYFNRIKKVEANKALTFHLVDLRNRNVDQKQYLDFEIRVVSRNGDDNYNYINNATNDILSALFSGITELQATFGNQCRWIPDEQNFEIEFTADYKQAETIIAVSLLHYIGDSLFEVDITDYTVVPVEYKTFKTADGKTFKTADSKTLKVPSE